MFLIRLVFGFNFQLEFLYLILVVSQWFFFFFLIVWVFMIVDEIAKKFYSRQSEFLFLFNCFC